MLYLVATDRRNSLLISLLYLLLFASMKHEIDGLLTPEEECQMCQRILFYTFQYYRKQSTKRFLRHRIEHMCKRYYEYKRQCMMKVWSGGVELVWEDMERALPAGDYKPWPTCERLKQCAKDQSPLKSQELRNAAAAVAAVDVDASKTMMTTTIPIITTAAAGAPSLE